MKEKKIKGIVPKSKLDLPKATIKTKDWMMKKYNKNKDWRYKFNEKDLYFFG